MIIMTSELDETTRYKMKSTETFTNDFYIGLLIVLCVFLLGFVAGNVAHDTTFHPVHDIELK